MRETWGSRASCWWRWWRRWRSARQLAGHQWGFPLRQILRRGNVIAGDFCLLRLCRRELLVLDLRLCHVVVARVKVLLLERKRQKRCESNVADRSRLLANNVNIDYSVSRHFLWGWVFAPMGYQRGYSSKSSHRCSARMRWGLCAGQLTYLFHSRLNILWHCKLCKLEQVPLSSREVYNPTANMDILYNYRLQILWWKEEPKIVVMVRGEHTIGETKFACLIVKYTLTGSISK